MKNILLVVLCLSLLSPGLAFGAGQKEMLAKIEALSKELTLLKTQLQVMQENNPQQEIAALKNQIRNLEEKDPKPEITSLKESLQQIQDKDAEKETRIKAVEKKADKATEPSPIKISGDYRFRADSMSGNVHNYMQYIPTTKTPYTPGPGMPSYLVGGIPGYSPKNSSVMLNRLGFTLRGDATEDITVHARFLMYKVWGHETGNPVSGNFFADRAFGMYDGVVGHSPSDNSLRVDQAYATLSNIGRAPVWFSVGRRPSTGGVPNNLRQNIDKRDNSGIPGILVDYAFDGLTLGWAPEIKGMPGAYAKFCFGRGFDSGYKSQFNTLKDTDFYGYSMVPYEDDRWFLQLQYQKGYNIFNVPSDGVNFFGTALPVSQNLGDLTWTGGVVQYRHESPKSGSLTLFASGAQSKTSPNSSLFSLPFFSMDGGKTFQNAGFGLLYDDNPMTPAVDVENHTGSAYYLGARYDFKNSGTKLGVEYNQGSKYWVGMVPAGDDLWTSKLGTRGHVWETYLIHELRGRKRSPKGKAFLRLGYQLYTFDYTGSNNWVGAPKKISDLTTLDPSGTQLLAPLSKASDLYLTLDVLF